MDAQGEIIERTGTVFQHLE
jgi:hypothetical protein